MVLDKTRLYPTDKDIGESLFFSIGKRAFLQNILRSTGTMYMETLSLDAMVILRMEF
jgi:hypothetical protein